MAVNHIDYNRQTPHGSLLHSAHLIERRSFMFTRSFLATCFVGIVAFVVSISSGEEVMAVESQTRSPSVVVTEGAGVAWNNPTRITMLENFWSSMILHQGQSSNWIKATGFGFEIPEGATIVGIKDRYRKRCTFSEDKAADDGVRLVVAGEIRSTDKSNPAHWPLSFTYVEHGGENDTWGETLTPAQVNSLHFGGALKAKNAVYAEGAAVMLDHLERTVYYELP